VIQNGIFTQMNKFTVLDTEPEAKTAAKPVAKKVEVKQVI